MGIEVRRVTVELPIPAWNRLVRCQVEVGASTVVEVIRHALMAYERELASKRLGAQEISA